MSSMIASNVMPSVLVVSAAGAHPNAGAPTGKQRLPTDPIGAANVTFRGVNSNSEIRVFLPSGTEAAGVESCVADPVLSWSVYAPGNPNNVVTIRIVHPIYKIKEFNYTASAGVANLPVQQELDPWYSNP